MRTIKDIDKEDLEYLVNFIGSDIHCIKDFKPENVSIGGLGIKKFIKVDNFYNLEHIFFNTKSYTLSDLYKVYMKENCDEYYPLIKCGGSLYYYDNFFKHFELRTIQDIRRDKIKSILD